MNLKKILDMIKEIVREVDYDIYKEMQDGDWDGLLGIAHRHLSANRETDPLAIMNEFTKRPLGVPAFPYDDYWTKKLAALCDEVAMLRDVNKQLRGQ
jgi:hypothetical protein